MKRRHFLQSMIGAASLSLLAPVFGAIQAISATMVKKMTLSDKEWKNKLNSKQYDVLREEGTERPFTSTLLEEHRAGVFTCAACGLPLFLSETKFDSGTGWPSFYASIEGNVETKVDYKIGIARTEYHCARCGGHQGHVFEDGPKPTGLRYCNNGVALSFIAKGTSHD